VTPFPSKAIESLVSLPPAFEASCRELLLEARAAAEDLAAGKPRGRLSALERYDETFGTIAEVSARSSLARNVHPDPELRKVAEKCEQEAEELSSALALDPRLYAALRALEEEGLDPASRHLLHKALRDFRRAGVDRDEATRARVKALRDELVRIGQEFGRNIKDDVRSLAFEPGELEGLPDDYVRAHPPGPDGKVRITTDNTDYVPFITYARSGKAREALWRLYRLRGHPANLEVLTRLFSRRAELAALLGYPSFAAYATEDKMIGSDAQAGEFIARVTAASAARLERDYAQLLERARESDPSAARVPAWDSPFLQERVKAERYGFDAREARPYFEYRRVREGVFAVAGRLFGVSFHEVKDAPRWHPEVEVLDVREGEKILGRVYLDMHPRDGKYKHYAQFTLASGLEGTRLPEGVLVCNFPRPGASPALLEHDEVRTFLHEVGHLMHHLLGGHVRYATQSGVATEWDFVEAPSQMLEEWAWDPDTLRSFARHLTTGEPIPRDLVVRMRAADEYGKGLWVRQQMFYAALSLEVHRGNPAERNLDELVARLQEAYTPFRYVEGTYFHASFGHLDGYSALYYTYMWSLVIAKDLFGAFKKRGLFDEETLRRYRQEVLEPGGSKKARDLVSAFLGRDFSFEAFKAWLEA